MREELTHHAWFWRGSDPNGTECIIASHGGRDPNEYFDLNKEGLHNLTLNFYVEDSFAASIPDIQSLLSYSGKNARPREVCDSDHPNVGSYHLSKVQSTGEKRGLMKLAAFVLRKDDSGKNAESYAQIQHFIDTGEVSAPGLNRYVEYKRARPHIVTIRDRWEKKKGENRRGGGETLLNVLHALKDKKPFVRTVHCAFCRVTNLDKFGTQQIDYVK